MKRYSFSLMILSVTPRNPVPIHNLRDGFTVPGQNISGDILRVIPTMEKFLLTRGNWFVWVRTGLKKRLQSTSRRILLRWDMLRLKPQRKPLRMYWRMPERLSPKGMPLMSGFAAMLQTELEDRNEDPDNNGYTNLEEYLHSLTAGLQ
ncbi:MAG TPA: hypothetical protein ENI20_11270 [Bacteroides sp.]|nr:hypothetical protein [Bacteroides sp.]